MEPESAPGETETRDILNLPIILIPIRPMMVAERHPFATYP
jgi:hypothetical protein